MCYEYIYISIYHDILGIVRCEQLLQTVQTEVAPKLTGIPEIYTNNVSDFSIFNKKLITLTGTNNIEFKSTLSFLIVRPIIRITYYYIND